MKIVKIIKSLLFILLGVCFFSVKFYEINQEVIFEDGTTKTFLWWLKNGIDVSTQLFNENFDVFFKQNGLNLVVSLLFIGVGVLELIQVKGMNRNGN